MSHGNFLEYCDFISDLIIQRQSNRNRNHSCAPSHHVLPPSHESLVNDLGRIVSSCVDMYILSPPSRSQLLMFCQSCIDKAGPEDAALCRAGLP